MLVARISLTLSRHFSLPFIASGRSSGLHPVSSHSCWMYVRAGRPAFVRPYAGVHKSTSLMSSSLLLQQCPACLVRLTVDLNKVNNWSNALCLCHLMETEAVFSKTGMNNIRNVDFLQNSSLCHSAQIFRRVVRWSKNAKNSSFQYDVKLLNCIYFNVLHVYKSIFTFGK